MQRRTKRHQFSRLPNLCEPSWSALGVQRQTFVNEDTLGILVVKDYHHQSSNDTSFAHTTRKVSDRHIKKDQPFLSRLGGDRIIQPIGLLIQFELDFIQRAVLFFYTIVKFFLCIAKKRPTKEEDQGVRPRVDPNLCQHKYRSKVV